MEQITQGDLRAMAIYTIPIIPLILMPVAEVNQVNKTIKTAQYVDDLTTAGAIICLRNWWKILCRLRPTFGHFPDGSKLWLIANVMVDCKGKSGAKSSVYF